MSSISYYTQALRRRMDRRWFDWRCRDILRTPPIQTDASSPVVIVSQLYSPDVIMYLLAAKSFCRYLRPREFVIVDDGLTADDRHTLAHHLGQVRYRLSSEVSAPDCPRGGCWERLLTLSDENRAHYVIQLDSDTLTIAPPHEVMRCVQQGRTFTLGTSSGRQIIGAREAARLAETQPTDHVQSHAERALAHFADAETLRYVRGCAGFTGFAPGDLPKERILEVAREFSRLLGPQRFAQWGSEQVTSNLMAANAPEALVLPVDTYPFWAPGLALQDAALVHFFGTFRYLQGMYLSQSRRVARALLAGA